MSQQDVVKNVSKGVVVGGAAVVVFFVVVFAASIFGSSDYQESKDLRSERIKPLGEVNIVGNTATVVAQAPVTKKVVKKTGPAKSGQEVYNSVCTACHGTGIAGAPKYGDKDLWTPRIAKGEATLVQHALNGINAMPPRGGNPDLSDEEIKGAVHYILKAVGVSSADTATATPATTTAAVTVPSKSGKEIYDGVCTACHAIGLVGAPKFGDKDMWTPRIAKGEAALLHSALNGLNAMPPRGGNPNLSDEDVKAAINYMLEAVSEKTAEPVATSPAASSPDLARGEQVYQTICQACHALGIVGAPKFGDKGAWKSRVAQGMETLFSHALNGYQGKTGVMPPKGGAVQLSDDDVKAAAAYMVSKVK